MIDTGSVVSMVMCTGLFVVVLIQEPKSSVSFPDFHVKYHQFYTGYYTVHVSY